MTGTDFVEPEALVRYLRDLAQLRTSTITDVDRYHSVLWLNDLPEHPKVRSALSGHLADQAAWIVIDKVRLPTRPEPESDLIAWLDGVNLDRPDREPGIRESIMVTERRETGDGPVLERVECSLDDRRDIQALWRRYLHEWRDWAARRRALDPVQAVYTQLFQAAEHIRQVGEQVEAVMAVGLLVIPGERGLVRRHLLTAPAEITLDAHSGRITVEPETDSSQRITLEQDMVAPAQTPPTKVQNAIREALTRLEDPLTDPIDLNAISPLLAMWVQGASSEGQFDPDLAAGPSATRATHPVVRVAPALIVRPRSRAAILNTYNEMLAGIEEGEPVPPTFGDLATTQSGDLTDEERAASGLELSGERWFPLPSNSEQAQIVEALRTRRGVIVHGPPGTGKSHTIANLISHAMAMGQRVLVTSHSARALEVLADKLPADIRALTVTMLGQGRRGTDDLEKSANEILRRRQDPQWKPAEIRDRLEQLTERLAVLRSQRSELIKALGALRAQEMDGIDLGFGGYSGTRAAQAQELLAQPPTPAWLTVKPVGEAPLSRTEVDELLAIRRRLGDAELANGRLELLPESEVPNADTMRTLIGEFLALRHQIDAYADVPRQAMDAVGSVDPRVIAELSRLRRAFEAAQRALAQRRVPWLEQTTRDLAQGNEAAWRSILGHTSDFLAWSMQVHELDRIRVDIAPGANRLALRAQAAELVAFFEGGGTMRRIGALNAKPVKAAQELFEHARVDGAIADDLETCRQFIRWCDAIGAIETIERYWPPGVLAITSTFAQRRSHIVDAHGALTSAFAAYDSFASVTGFIAANALAGLTLPGTSDSLDRTVAAIAAHRRFAAAKAALAAHHESFRRFVALPGTNPVYSLLATAIEQCDAPAYVEAHARLADAHQLRIEVQRYDELLGKLSATLPAAADLLASGDSDDGLAELRSLHEHWDRARARAWLNDLDRPDANSACRSLADIDDEIRRVVRDIGANRAWLAGLGRLTEGHTQHLKGYQSAMKRVGKGNSKFDHKYRDEARLHLEQCQDAIPAWVMPAHQVAATMPRKSGLFDLVVIDEASQSGVEELFLFWLGKQVVVVGDKQQISPEGSFVKGQAMGLQRDHLGDWSFAGDFGPENSLFDVAEVKYVQGEVWLSEHFRSMPEIIEFSNKLCYPDHRLQPVRQFGVERLPPLRRTHLPHVPDGSGSAAAAKINRVEAEAIVAQVIECIADPAYRFADGSPMTMGVISLLGPAQAKLIQQRLLVELDTATLSERRLHVGDAADFQGDERDIIFLSMVKTPSDNGARIPKLGHDRDARRFNVAASRARDQLWLFHSLKLDELNSDCPRAQLISHIDNPGLEGLAGFEEAVDANKLTPPFESLFEQRVFLDLVNREYQVQPQWKVLGYRIDLVVIGADSRLAIEIDGDHWHGPEKYAEDLARQGDLERVGWRIVRVKEWEYYTDKASALAPVFEALRELNIGPRATRLAEVPVPPRPLVTSTAAPTATAFGVARRDVEDGGSASDRADSASNIAGQDNGGSDIGGSDIGGSDIAGQDNGGSDIGGSDIGMPDPGKGFGEDFGNESAQTPADNDVMVRTASSLRNPQSWDKKPAMTVEAVPLRAQQPEPSPPSHWAATPSSPSQHPPRLM